MAVFGAAYQLNLMAAGVPGPGGRGGVKAFAPEALLLTATSVAASVLLWFPRRPARR